MMLSGESHPNKLSTSSILYADLLRKMLNNQIKILYEGCMDHTNASIYMFIDFNISTTKAYWYR